MLNKAQDDELVMSLVDLALARPAEERDSYLQSACAGDPDLYQQVASYVAWETRMHGFLLDPYFSAHSLEHPFEPGELLDARFRIIREVAQGGMGVVYEAQDEKLNRRIALKCAKAGFGQRLPPEVRNATEISHRNVCKIFEIHSASTQFGDIDFLTMEFLAGETLASRLSRDPLSDDQAFAIAGQLCAGLAEAHRSHVIHGDLKSNNVILTTAADGDARAVITDFGLASRPEAVTLPASSGVSGGTPEYMAPELLKGAKASVASDIYALGIILHELAYAKRPSAGPAPLHKPKWDRLISKCLNPDPELRYSSANEIAAAIAPRSRNWRAAAAVSAVAFIASTLFIYYRVPAPQEVVRLAVLPFQSDLDAGPLSEGLLLETGETLKRVRGGRVKLTLLPVTDALQNKVDQPRKARTMLGATHSLSGQFRWENGKLIVHADLTDSRSLVKLKEWNAEYPTSELRNVPVALAGLATSTLGLPRLGIAASVTAAAYPDYAAGVSYLRREPDADRALASLRRAVTSDPESPLTHARFAEAQLLKFRLTGDPQWREGAIASLKNAERRNPDVAAVRIVSAMIHDTEGQYEQAEMDLKRAIELEPANADAWRRLGRTYESANRPPSALTAYLKAIEIQPEYFRNHQELGSFYIQRGEYENAVGAFKREIELAPDLAISHFMLGAAYANMGRYSDAESQFRTALTFEETADAVEGLGVACMYQGRDFESIPYFKRVLELGPKTSLRFLNLGTAFRRSGQPHEAESAYRKGLDLAEARLAANPRDAYEKSCLAYICARLGERRRAEAEAAQAYQLAQGMPSVAWMVALAYEALGEHERTLFIAQNAPDSLLSRLNRFPDLDDLRQLPRFQDLIRSHNIH